MPDLLPVVDVPWTVLNARKVLVHDPDPRISPFRLPGRFLPEVGARQAVEDAGVNVVVECPHADPGPKPGFPRRGQSGRRGITIVQDLALQEVRIGDIPPDLQRASLSPLSPLIELLPLFR